MHLYLVACPFISSLMYSVVWLMNKCKITCIPKVHSAFIEQNLLAATSTALVKVLIGPAVCYAGVCTSADSVHQNCVLERCANLYFITVVQLYPY